MRVATILENPVVEPREMTIYTTNTKDFPAYGSVFHHVDVANASKSSSIVIDGLSAVNYKIQVWVVRKKEVGWQSRQNVDRPAMDGNVGGWESKDNVDGKDEWEGRCM